LVSLLFSWAEFLGIGRIILVIPVWERGEGREEIGETLHQQAKYKNSPGIQFAIIVLILKHHPPLWTLAGQIAVR